MGWKHVQAVNMATKKKVNVPVTGKHALLSLVVFDPLLYTVYVLFMIMLLGCTLV